jgi:hypothetical protein
MSPTDGLLALRPTVGDDAQRPAPRPKSLKSRCFEAAEARGVAQLPLTDAALPCRAAYGRHTNRLADFTTRKDPVVRMSSATASAYRCHWSVVRLAA